MACYDCEYCPNAEHNGGKCNRFLYDCPFYIVRNFDEVDIKIIKK